MPPHVGVHAGVHVSVQLFACDERVPAAAGEAGHSTRRGSNHVPPPQPWDRPQGQVKTWRGEKLKTQMERGEACALEKPGRAICSGCERPARVCYCGKLPKPPLSFSGDFAGVVKGLVVYVHPLEAKRKMGSLPLLTRAVTPVHVFQRRKPGTVKLPRSARFRQSPRGEANQAGKLPNCARDFPESGLASCPPSAAASTSSAFSRAPPSPCPGAVSQPRGTSASSAPPQAASAGAWIYDADVSVFEGGCCTKPFLPQSRSLSAATAPPAPLAPCSAAAVAPAASGCLFSSSRASHPCSSCATAPCAAPSLSRSPASAEASTPSLAAQLAAPPPAPQGEANNLLLLFPAPWSFELGRGAFPLQLPVTLLCLDGTWKEAKEMLNAAPWLADVPAVRLPGCPLFSEECAGVSRADAGAESLGRRADETPEADGWQPANGGACCVPGGAGGDSGGGDGRLLAADRGAPASGEVVGVRAAATAEDGESEEAPRHPGDSNRLAGRHRRSSKTAGDANRHATDAPPQAALDDRRRDAQAAPKRAAASARAASPSDPSRVAQAAPGGGERGEGGCEARAAAESWGAYKSVRTPSRKIADEGGVCTAEAVARSLAAIAQWSRGDCSERAKAFDASVLSLLTFVASKQRRCKEEDNAVESENAKKAKPDLAESSRHSAPASAHASAQRN
ncbi:hypothetical protein BESB_057090 [Besnoitia besnoiti]|uniref:tRNA-uridine aminocarboxypropyltransferase n=1 Tax=Besnoitia besnoiti TaxID=94643 RepID=A0A2A9MC43_BESBE|nr:hypothetical protein BESB_057090 [Besnoitia besnoiti]PFH36058.1 hypothetical protein BESB_057090 [Besnoitia besnoiti]